MTKIFKNAYANLCHFATCQCHTGQSLYTPQKVDSTHNTTSEKSKQMSFMYLAILRKSITEVLLLIDHMHAHNTRVWHGVSEREQTAIIFHSRICHRSAMLKLFGVNQWFRVRCFSLECIVVHSIKFLQYSNGIRPPTAPHGSYYHLSSPPVQGVPENAAQRSTRVKFETVCRKMKSLVSKCSAEITVYQSTQNLCKWVKYSLLNSRKRLHVCRTVRRLTDRPANKCFGFYCTVKLAV